MCQAHPQGYTCPVCADEREGQAKAPQLHGAQSKNLAQLYVDGLQARAKADRSNTQDAQHLKNAQTHAGEQYSEAPGLQPPGQALNEALSLCPEDEGLPLRVRHPPPTTTIPPVGEINCSHPGWARLQGRIQHRSQHHPNAGSLHDSRSSYADLLEAQRNPGKDHISTRLAMNPVFE